VLCVEMIDGLPHGFPLISGLLAAAPLLPSQQAARSGFSQLQ
jgi:hypothetical protein